MVAVAESTPGPIAINCATYVGYKRAGVPGAAWATLGVVLPSFIIIYIISLFIEQFMSLQVIQNAFMGIQAAVAVLILRAGVQLLRKMPRKPFGVILAGLAFAAVFLISLFGWNFSTIWLILMGGVCGLALMGAQNLAGKGGVH